MDDFNFAQNHRAHACFMVHKEQAVTSYWVCTKQQVSREKAVEWWTRNGVRHDGAHTTMDRFTGWYAWATDKNVLWTDYWKK